MTPTDLGEEPSVRRSGARLEMVYVPTAYQERATVLIENYRQARAAMDWICEINLELLRRRDELE